MEGVTMFKMRWPWISRSKSEKARDNLIMKYNAELRAQSRQHEKAMETLKAELDEVIPTL
jgi:hypothetical protein